MPSLIDSLINKRLITPPKWMTGSTQYEVQMGSHAYGVANTDSDIDIYGFCMPPIDIIYPYKKYIFGYDNGFEKFDQFQQVHVFDNNKEYDVAIYNIVKYFRLCADCNPNMIDSLFVPDNCVIYKTNISDMVRKNRTLFLSKKAWHTFKGYAYSQMSKITSKHINEWVKLCNNLEINPLEANEKLLIENKEYGNLYKTITTDGKITNRIEYIIQYGYDIKFAYHIVRLLNEVEQILMCGDIDLQQNNEQLKSIRRGEWTEDKVKDYFLNKEKVLEIAYANSTIPYSPQEDKIRELLFNCLEEYYR